MLVHHKGGLTPLNGTNTTPLVNLALPWTALRPLDDAPHRLRERALPEKRKIDLSAYA